MTLHCEHAAAVRQLSEVDAAVICITHNSGRAHDSELLSILIAECNIFVIKIRNIHIFLCFMLKFYTYNLLGSIEVY